MFQIRTTFCLSVICHSAREYSHIRSRDRCKLSTFQEGKLMVPIEFYIESPNKCSVVIIHTMYKCVLTKSHQIEYIYEIPFKLIIEITLLGIPLIHFKLRLYTFLIFPAKFTGKN